MLKKGLILFLVLALLVSVTACGAGGDQSKDDTKTTTTTGSAVQEDSSSDTSDAVDDDDMVEDVPGQGNGTPVDTLPQEKINEALFIAGSPDGYAVVEYEDVYYCVNGRGEITGRLTDCYPYAKPSPAGYVLVDTVDDGLGVVDSTGKLMFTEASLGVSGFTKPEMVKNTLWYDYAVPSMQDGYLMAYKVEETYNNVVYSVGVVNMKGEWVVPLSAEHPIVKDSDCWNEGGLEQLIFYAGSDAFVYCTEAGYLGIYNVKTNKSAQVDLDMADVIFTDDYDRVFFVEGRLVWRDVYMQATYYKTIDVNGKYEKFLSTDGSGSNVEHSKTYFINERYFWVGNELWDRATLTKVAKEKYNLYYEAAYVGGYKPVLIENQAGSIYFGLENADGYKFEPVKVEHSDYNVTLYEDGTYVMCVEWKNGNHNVGYVYDYNGTLLNVAQGDLYAGMELRNGIIRTKDGNDMVYHKATDEIDYWL